MYDLFGDDELSCLPEQIDSSQAVSRETHRMMQLLRFNAAAGGVYVARCAPEYYVLPALAEHFTVRFGETPWAIIDEKRSIALTRLDGGEPLLEALSGPLLEKLFPAGEIRGGAAGETPDDGWEDLWKRYYRSINIENRKNPDCRRQNMPKRYWKYLPEVQI
jgi:probable DNA metabolism protein